jgi:hypothetical protein
VIFNYLGRPMDQNNGLTKELSMTYSDVSAPRARFNASGDLVKS